ncbi:hypothetical protein D7D52_03290 [Nocardia yunnanensis]|uniref:Link domain-containing protein n=1 Tax=Nocardia yunnanensis TaxID=2382165 RepID=A0A386Z5K1_9NOCA|nr:hypothetical protein [Nocardia yunnanensis]AYF73052.1 hypothetical protein D7D52_03290 [Nocardia yunnanensis]
MIKPLTLLAAATLATGGLGIGTAADSRMDGLAAARAEAACLWAGEAHPQGSRVVAGGWAFTCGSDAAGPRWSRGGAGGASTVPNPGADANPVGRFSAGARQPGADYDDYCVGDQLVPGVGDVFEAVPTSGGLLWKSAGPIGQWTFDPGVTQPKTSTRSTSLCRDGQLL